MLGIAYDSYAARTTKVTETQAGVQLAYEVREISTGGFDRGVSKGMTVDGKADTVISRGSVVVEGDTYVGRKGHGQFLKRGLSQYLN